MNIEPSTGVPTAYQKEHSNLSVLLRKRELLEKPRKTLDIASEHKDFYSRIDDDKLTEFELAQYWRVLGKIFQLGHVRRGNTHFRHYDIPERLLFNKMTLLELQAYIKQFIWSFQKEIHYIIYPRDLTAALLAHIVASRFLKKPRVVEARKYIDGSLALPNYVTSRLGEKHVLLVDDAINTCATMTELIGLIKIYGGIVSGIFTITNRTTPEVEATLRSLVPKVACAYRLRLDVFRIGNCKLCDDYNALMEKQKSAASREYFQRLTAKINELKVMNHETA
jgi:hypothetical protein